MCKDMNNFRIKKIRKVEQTAKIINFQKYNENKDFLIDCLDNGSAIERYLSYNYLTRA